MKTFKTKSGTELTTIDLKGRPYLEVAQRILWFREESQGWSLQTTPHQQEGVWWFRAEVRDEKGTLVATGHRKVLDPKLENEFEVAETGAIGRALANSGFGTQFALELSEGTRLADAPVTVPNSFNGGFYSNVQTVEPSPELLKNTSDYVIRIGKKYLGRTLKSLTAREIEGYMDYFVSDSKKNNKPLSKDVSEFLFVAEKYLSETPGLFNAESVNSEQAVTQQ